MAVMEGGGEDIYKLFLRKPPTANVEIAIISDRQTTANVDLVTIIPHNWNITQLVRRSGIDNDLSQIR